MCNVWFLCAIYEFNHDLFCLSVLCMYLTLRHLRKDLRQVWWRHEVIKGPTSIQCEHSSSWSCEVRNSGDKIKGRDPLKWEECSWDKFLWEKVSCVRDSPSWENSHGILNKTLPWDKPKRDKSSGNKPSGVNYIKLVYVPMWIFVGLNMSHLNKSLIEITEFPYCKIPSWDKP